MSVIAKLKAVLSVDGTKFERGLDRADRRSQSFSKRIKTSMKAATAAFAAFTTVVSTASAAGVAFGLKAIKTADDIGKVADKLGIATSELQKLRFAADQAGVAQTALDMGIQRFTRRVAEAAKGTGEAKAILEEYGVQLTDANGNIRPTIDLLKDVADRMAAVEDPAERLRIAFKLFDSEGVAMVNMLKNGSTSLQGMTDKAQMLGLVMEDDIIRKAERASDNLSMLGQIVKTNFSAGVLDGFVDDFNEFTERAQDPELARNLRETGELLGSMGTAAFRLAEGFLRFTASVNKVREELGGGKGEVRLLQTDPYSDFMQAVENPPKIKEGQNTLYDVLGIDMPATKQKTEETKQSITTLSTQIKTTGTYGAREIKKLENSFEDTTRAVEDQKRKMGELASESADLFANLINGTQDFRDIAISAISDIARNIVKMSFGGSSSGGIFGTIAESIFGGIFGGYTQSYSAPSVAPPPRKPSFSFATGISKVPYDMDVRVHRGEQIVPAQKVRAMDKSGGDTIYNIDARGADAGVEQRIKKVMMDMEALRKDVPKISVSSVKNANNRNLGFLS